MKYLGSTLFVIVWCFLSVTSSLAGVIILKNGKRITCKGPYAVKGNLIHFTTMKGQPYQLPVKVVNLEKSDPNGAAVAKKKKPTEKPGKSAKTIFGHQDIDYTTLVTEKTDPGARDNLSIDNTTDLRTGEINRTGYVRSGSGKERRMRSLLASVERNSLYHVGNHIRQGLPIEGSLFDNLKLEQPLNQAIISGHDQIVAILLQAGVDGTYLSRTGIPPMTLALQNGRFEIAKILLAAKVPVKDKGRGSKWPLEAALESSEEKLILGVLGAGADVDVRSADSNPVFFKAVGSSSPMVVAAFLEKGASPNTRSKDGVSVLVHAVANGKAKVASLLLEKEANASARDKDNRNIMEIAAQNGDGLMISILQARTNFVLDASHHLLRAVESKDAKRAMVMLEMGAEVDIKDSLGDPLSVIAARNSDIDMIKVLAGADADMYAKGSDGLTAYAKTEGPNKNEIHKLLRVWFRQNPQEK